MKLPFDKYDYIVGGVIAALTTVFGEAWFLFALYLMFQILDWLTGWYKAYIKRKESSKAGLLGLLKKLGYWIAIIVGFAVSLAFAHLGKMIALPLEFLNIIGWFVLASLMVNEARSILENLVECGYNIPMFLIKGLAVTDKLINSKADTIFIKEERK